MQRRRKQTQRAKERDGRVLKGVFRRIKGLHKKMWLDCSDVSKVEVDRRQLRWGRVSNGAET